MSQQRWWFYVWAELSLDQSLGQSTALSPRPLTPLQKTQAAVKTGHAPWRGSLSFRFVVLASGEAAYSAGMQLAPKRLQVPPQARLTANHGTPRSSTAQQKKSYTNSPVYFALSRLSVVMVVKAPRCVNKETPGDRNGK